MAVPQEKPGETTAEEDEEITKELCLINGINYNRLMQEGAATLQLEMFFSGYPRMVGLRHFHNLLSLVIVGQAISKIEALSAVPQLRELWIAECKLQKIDGLEDLKMLQKLYIYSNEIHHIENLTHLTELEVLWLNGNEIKDIEGLSHLSELKDLNLAENRIEKIGNSLNRLSKLESLELSGNRISSFKDLTHLVRLPHLVELGLKSPMYTPCLVGLLCNYQTHILYHLPNLSRLDTYDVTTKQVKDHAEMTVVKKKMYYNMKVKTLRRNLGELLSRLKSAHLHLLNIPYDKLSQLLVALKALEKEIKTSEAGETNTRHEGHRAVCIEEEIKEAKDKGSGDQSQHQMALVNKLKAIKGCIKKWERKTAEIDHYWSESSEKVQQMTDSTIQRLMIELETGGNVRFEDGKPSDVWFSSCHDLLLSRFCAADYKDYGIVGIKIHRITRVHNRVLRSKFEDNLAHLIEDDDLYNPATRAASQKKLLEYLFFVWDPTLPGGSTEPIRVLDEGFLHPSTYKKLGRDAAVPLANSLSLADKHRMAHVAKQSRGQEFTDSCPFRHGQVIVAKIYVGKSIAHTSSKIVDAADYPKFDTVYRARRDIKESPVPSLSGASGDVLSVSGPSVVKPCECRRRQSEWFAFNQELVMPEYVIDFEYLARVKPRSPFASFTEAIADNRERPPLPTLEDLPSVDDVFHLEPEIRPRTKIANLTEEGILNAAGVTALNNVKVLDLHGCGLTKLRHMQALPHLRKLTVSFNDLTRLDDISHLNLEYLDASFNRLTSLDGIKGLQKLKYLDISWNQLMSTRDEISTLRKHASSLTTLDLRYNNWQKPRSLRLRAIGRIKTLSILNGTPVGEAEAAAALRLAAGSRISQVSLLTHCRTDLTTPRTLNLAMYAQVLTQCSWNKPDRVSDQDSLWYMKVTTLNLDGQHISKLSNLDRLENLRWASFNDNDITKIEGLDKCGQLEELSLEHNCLTRLEGLSRLLRLQRLAVGHNFVTSLENAGLERLPNLTFLSLENNQIPSMAGLQRLSGLVELYIGNNNISNIREVFYLKPLPNLVILDLYGNPVATSVDSYRLFVIFHLKGLKALDGTAIELSEATQAKDAFGGRLTSDFVAERLGHADFNEIKELDFPHCSIRTVDIGNGDSFLNLRSVNLEHNNLTSFSGLIFLINLRVLCLNHNHVECVVPRPKHLPASLRKGLGERTATLASGVDPFNPDSYTPVLENLEVLHLGYNNIKDMAALQLSRLTSLKALFLQGNEITKVEGLEGLQDLRELVLDRNKIKAISEYSFCNQWNLQELHMEENRLRDISHLCCLENLQRLFLGMNRIQDMCELERFEQMPHLVELSVVGNAVARRLLHRPMLVYRMSNLLVIDGIPVSDEERAKAELYFMEQQRETSNFRNFTKAVGGNANTEDGCGVVRWRPASSESGESPPPQVPPATLPPQPPPHTKPQQSTMVETTLPGIGQYKAQIPVKVTNMQLLSGPFVDKTFGGTLQLTDDVYQQDIQRAFLNLPQGGGRRRGGYREGVPSLQPSLGGTAGGRVGLPFQQAPGTNHQGGNVPGLGSRSQHQVAQVPYVPHQGGATDHYGHTESLTRLNKNNRR